MRPASAGPGARSGPADGVLRDRNTLTWQGHGRAISVARIRPYFFNFGWRREGAAPLRQDSRVPGL